VPRFRLAESFRSIGDAFLSGKLGVYLVVGQFQEKCPTNFSLSEHHDKLKLIEYQTEPRTVYLEASAVTATLSSLEDRRTLFQKRTRTLAYIISVKQTGEEFRFQR